MTDRQNGPAIRPAQGWQDLGPQVQAFALAMEPEAVAAENRQVKQHSGHLCHDTCRWCRRPQEDCFCPSLQDVIDSDYEVLNASSAHDEEEDYWPWDYPAAA